MKVFLTNSPDWAHFIGVFSFGPISSFIRLIFLYFHFIVIVCLRAMKLSWLCYSDHLIVLNWIFFVNYFRLLFIWVSSYIQCFEDCSSDKHYRDFIKLIFIFIAGQKLANVICLFVWLYFIPKFIKYYEF